MPRRSAFAKTYVQRHDRMVEKWKLNDLPPEEPTAPEIMVDSYGENPVVSPVDWKPINSRRSLREHNKRNDVVDVGSDSAYLRPRRVDHAARERELKADMKEAYQKFRQNNPEALAFREKMRREARDMPLSARGDIRLYE